MLESTLPAAISRPRRSPFFVGMSFVLLLIVVAGFAKTFYLRAFFAVPPIPAHVYVHGAVLTGWFAWLCLQTSLVSAGRISLHRRLGVVGAFLGAAVVVANATVVAEIGPRLRFLLQSGKVDAAFLMRVVWGDIGSAVAFALLLSAALWYRRSPEIHKRLMFLASVAIIGQAVARIAHWPLLAGISPSTLAAGTMVFFPACLLIYDILAIKRVHPATIVGGAFRVLIWAGSMFVAASEVGQGVVRSLL